MDEAWSVLDGLLPLSAGELEKYCKSDNEAVRYWAAIGLGNLASHAQYSRSIKQTLEPVLKDKVPAVRAAAAQGILFLEQSKPALDALKEIITDKKYKESEHLLAIHALGLAGKRALPLKGVMKATTFNGKYASRVRDELMPRIETAPTRVP